MAEIDTRIEAVTVYTDRARVRRRGRVSLPAGSHELVIKDLPINVLAESVRAAARSSGKARLLGTDVSQTFHPEPVEYKPAELLAQIEALEEEDRGLLRRLEALTCRRSFLQTLSASLGPELARGLAYGRSTIEVGVSANQFLDEQFALLDGQQQEVEARRRQLAKVLDATRSRLQGLGRRHLTERQQITVLLQTEAEGEMELEVTYQVTGAQWQPLYDLRVESANGSPRLRLSYQAQVTQNTGEAWEQVALSLSTAKPALSLRLPELTPWFVAIQPPAQSLGRAKARPVALAMEAVPAPAAAPPAAMFSEDEDEEAVDVAFAQMLDADEVLAEVEETGASVTFSVGGGTDIPDDGSPHKVFLGDWDLPAKFDYVSAPKLVGQAYRRARVTNGSPALLLPGEAQIFDGEEYVGSTRLKTVAPGQQFELFLGVDDRIKVERKLVEGSVDKKLLVDVRRMTYAYEIKVQNLKSGPETVTVWDQVPVSRHEQVKVRRTDTRPNPAEETELGKLRWELNLPPGQEAVIHLGFIIEAPRDRELIGLPPLAE